MGLPKLLDLYLQKQCSLNPSLSSFIKAQLLESQVDVQTQVNSWRVLTNAVVSQHHYPSLYNDLLGSFDDLYQEAFSVIRKDIH